MGRRGTSLRVLVKTAYASTISPTSRCRTTSLLVRGGEVHVVDVGEDVAHDLQPTAHVAGQVDLRDIAVTPSSSRNRAGSGHLHLFRRGVLRSSRMMNASLRLPSAHVGQRRHLDRGRTWVSRGIDFPGRLMSCSAFQQRPQVRVDLVVERAAEPEPLAASTAGRVRMMA